ncbi:MAG: PQQ-binding-like beta-propeller repeat protein, partial [Clostridia bacterium]|nr:PQQ-binding-like beta-propeller repeat protein [Clostridia bacterium]
DVYKRHDNVVAKLMLPIDVYNEQFGLSISYDNTKIYLQRWSTEFRCYSIIDGKILWRSKLKKVNYVYVYENLIYCSSYDKGFYVLDANSGEIIGRPIKIFRYYRAYRISKEVFFVHHDNEILCCNMATGKTWKPPIELGLNERLKELASRNEIKSVSDNFYIIQKMTDMGDEIMLKFITTKLDKTNDEVFIKLLKKDLIDEK